MTDHAAFIRHPGAARYKFNDNHPFHPMRLTLAESLLEISGALRNEQVAAADLDGGPLLVTVHRDDYIELVKALSGESPVPAAVRKASGYGLGTGDTPYFPGMHAAAAAIAAGSAAAADTVMSGRALHAYHMAGGLHHAFPDRGSGFCVYNDASIAITRIRLTHGARVMYIDTDVHHGDGVQWTFYHDPDVLTYSIHETGKYLFPGTGFVHERGADQGFGTAINVPLEPYTEDDSWLECFAQTVEKAAAAFKPDVIVSQHGCDAHANDPLSHIHCSMRIYRDIPAIVHRLAHRYAGGRWIALGGGGYDIWRVVPRAWAVVWLEMSGHPLAAALAEGNVPLPEGWLGRWQAESPDPLPPHWLDDTAGWEPMPRRAEIAERNRRTAEIAVQDV
ncbi:acetoin utilization protein AcuC [Paenibacillus humicola]|uniref:acetoin utilization protein AcuC n=1 Tax=Paenibacillus humicola TaxID=3110540 RepID=UPI00237AC330|nr:acetoin utilization protein AcuC [Paenibacillus humicola]